MSLSRIYQPISLEINQELRLQDAASHHVARVLRAKVGDHLTIFNGDGGEYFAEIKAIDKKGVTVLILRFDARDCESPIDIYLAQGIARGEKMDFIVQKAVELGVKKIMPIITERSNVRLDQERWDKRIAHWQAVAISSSEQCGRNRVTDILAPTSLKAWLPKADAPAKFVLTPNHTMTAFKSLNSPVILLIGPEGGLSDQEVELSIKNGFLPLNLGPRILRTETAGMVAASLFQGLFGDMRIADLA